MLLTVMLTFTLVVLYAGNGVVGAVVDVVDGIVVDIAMVVGDVDDIVAYDRGGVVTYVGVAAIGVHVVCVVGGSCAVVGVGYGVANGVSVKQPRNHTDNNDHVVTINTHNAIPTTKHRHMQYQQHRHTHWYRHTEPHGKRPYQQHS